MSHDGSFIVYATKSSNLQDTNITRADGGMFFNNPAEQATAKAVLVGPVGEIEVQDPGLDIKMDSYHRRSFGKRPGAIAEYEVDALGRISSINIISQGQDYNPETTVISVNDPRGDGFCARYHEVSFDQNFANNRIGEAVFTLLKWLNMTGYKSVVASNNGLDTLFQIQGNGATRIKTVLQMQKLIPLLFISITNQGESIWNKNIL